MDNDKIDPIDMGNGQLAPGPRRRRTDAPPEYRRSLLADPDVRSLIAAVVADASAALQNASEVSALELAGHRFTIRQLDAVADELSGQE